MPLLDDSARGQVAELFEGLESPVTLVLFTQATSRLALPGHLQTQTCPSCEDEEQLLKEIASLSDLIELEVHDLQAQPELAQEARVDRVPALILKGDGALGKVRFFGLPSGYEFSTLVTDIVDISTGNVLLSDEGRTRAERIETPVHLRVFVTPT